ncbi:hypothetical protein [Methylobacterium sp. J-092]|uniref:hypothetical protein n=1 Tax=Methylobacterium sp. J-092 TaxID=2836667 RepID=UPI001FB9A954|nr:hypothetical protein [Methylobacterium sp. J-092]MCJ2009789.1 hypothetical protein [Methylobacterium sp. J-092]
MSTLSEMKPFWMVQGSGPARFRHDTKAAATTEAERLARQHPGSVFVVMEAIEAVRKIDVQRVNLRDRQHDWSVDDDIPF